MIDGERRPLKPDTKKFLNLYPQSDYFWIPRNNFQILERELNAGEVQGRGQDLWFRDFVSRVFSVGTVADVESFFGPWERWKKIHSEIWSQSGRELADGGTREFIQQSHARAWQRFNDSEIPPEIREYQGHLLDDELKSMAHYKLFPLTQKVKSGIDLIEGRDKPASLDTIFMVQRVMNQPFHPVGGLEPDVLVKPPRKRLL
jgi:hypothetical protein